MVVKWGIVFVLPRERAVHLALKQSCRKRANQQQGKHNRNLTTRDKYHPTPHGWRCITHFTLSALLERKKRTTTFYLRGGPAHNSSSLSFFLKR